MQCAHCATPVPAEARFCQSCGSQVSDAEGQAAATGAMDKSAFAHMEALLRAETVGEFEVESLLGRGGMAVVYLATEVHLARKVAIKVLPPELTFGHGVERFKREAKTAAALDHPNIIPIYRIASGGKLFWYAMKYLEGSALDTLLKERGRFSLNESIKILEQVADALDYGHEHHVIHRDIKPANVMLDSRGRVVVTDFGIAKALTEGTLTASGSVIGTPYFMSPEQGMGKPVTGAADQYSVAVMAYRMISGQVPFEGDSAIDILHKHCMIPPPPMETVIPGLPRHVYLAVHKGLEKEPGRRFKSVTAFVKALTEPMEHSVLIGERTSESEVATVLVQASDVTARSAQMAAANANAATTPIPGLATRPGRGKARRGWPAWAIAAGIVLAAGTGWWFMLGPGAGGPDLTANPAATQPGGGEAVPAEPAAPPITTGTVTVTGLPAQGSIIWKGQRQAASFEVPAGHDTVTLRAPDYESQSVPFDIAAGGSLTIQFTAPRVQPAAGRPTPQTASRQPTTPAPGAPAVPQVAALRFLLRPPAEIFIDGAPLGEQGRYITELQAGVRHQIVLRRGGAVVFDTTVTPAAGETIDVRK
ncbi:MAG TPA: serine/threonine-protein kinase [Gemmatimonadales bacterium]